MARHITSLIPHKAHSDSVSFDGKSAQTWEHLENKGPEERFFSRQT
jgi:hypothetical protein